ncbi:MAG: hypothetical protein Q9167_000907 [Letrouitia subvulpina]
MSSRSLRRSRLPTPVNGRMTEAAGRKNETQAPRDKDLFLTEWEEPPTRTPAPSFEDYKGLERHGVLEHMQPLGTLPTHKVKLRLKAHDPPRRLAHLPFPEAAVSMTDEAGTPDPLPWTTSRRSESRKVEERLSKGSSVNQQQEDSDYAPNGTSKMHPTKGTFIHGTSYVGTTSSRTIASPIKLKQVVDEAVRNSHEMGNPNLGLVIRRLHEESSHNSNLADLLDAVLSQNPTAQQSLEFQDAISAARKQIKAEKRSSKRLANGRGAMSDSVSLSTSSPAEPIVPRPKEMGDANEFQPIDHTYRSDHALSRSSLQQHTEDLSKNMTLSSHKPPSHHTERSNSTSSLSSVATLSSVDQDLALKNESDLANIDVIHSPLHEISVTRNKAKHNAGPRMGTFPVSNSTKHSTKRPLSTIETPDDDQEAVAKRRKLKEKQDFSDYTVKDSDLRTVIQKHDDAPIQTRGTSNPRNTRNSQRGSVVDYNEPYSPTTSARSDLLSVPPPLGAIDSRRGITPTKGRPPKPATKAARVKHSPLKKKTGVVAGLPTAGGARNSPIGYGNPDGDEKNSDECAACSGTGTLLMCDGCDRSYHFTCAEPPKNEADGPPEGEWFCTVCQSQRVPTTQIPRGLFASLKTIANAKNPVAFHLPADLRNYYDGVRTGEDGEYEEPLPLKAKSRSGGYEIAPDPLRLKDKDKTILCHGCGKSAIEGRGIIDCDFCSLHWHLDCLDPPMANPPRGRTSWKCPAHIDLDIINRTCMTGQARKIRRVKNAKIIVPALRRGIRNNGDIEIEDESSEDDDDSTIYRLPSMGIKLDFIDRVKRARALDEASHAENPRKRQKTKAPSEHEATAEAPFVKDAFHNRPKEEREASYNLIRLFRADPNAPLGQDIVDNLVTTLIDLQSEAPADVVRTLRPKVGSAPLLKGPVVKELEEAGTTNVVDYDTGRTNNTTASEQSVSLPYSQELQLEALMLLEAAVKTKIASLTNKLSKSRHTATSKNTTESSLHQNSST